MKNKILTLTIILALLVPVLAGTLLINPARANKGPYPDPSTIVSVQLPENKTYTQSSIPVAFTVTGTLESYPLGFNGFSQFFYCLDGQAWTSFTPYQTSASPDFHQFSATLTGLSNGNHRLNITAEADFNGWPYGSFWWYTFSDSVPFTVNAPATSSSMRILILSAANSDYGKNAVSMPLNFSVNEPVSWVGYSVDNSTIVPLTDYAVLPQFSYGPNSVITTTDNRILMGLAEGSHTLTLYADDTAGNSCQSDELNFTIAQEAQPQQTAVPSIPEPSSTASLPLMSSSATSPVWVAAAAAGAYIVIVVSLLFYVRRRRHA